jgi:hypothetical protein
MDRPKLAISFSGGRSSAVMTKLCLEEYGDSHDIVVTFANTGCEHPATLDFVRDCDSHWNFNTVWLEAVIDPQPGVGVRHKVVTYETASRNGEPFEAFIAKYGMPNATAKFCTSRLKADVLESYRDSIGWVLGKGLNYQTAIGIRADEIDRMSIAAMKKGVIYPLADKSITKSKVNSIMASVPWDLKLPNDALGNCVWCWKKSDRKLYTLAKTHPEVFDFPLKMEQKYGDKMTTYPDGSPYAAVGPDGRRHFYRGHRDAADIIREASEKTGMVLYTDQIQTSIFDELLDLGGACSDGCEIGHD